MNSESERKEAALALQRLAASVRDLMPRFVNLQPDGSGSPHMLALRDTFTAFPTPAEVLFIDGTGFPDRRNGNAVRTLIRFDMTQPRTCAVKFAASVAATDLPSHRDMLKEQFGVADSLWQPISDLSFVSSWCDFNYTFLAPYDIRNEPEKCAIEFANWISMDSNFKEMFLSEPDFNAKYRLQPDPVLLAEELLRIDFRTGTPSCHVLRRYTLQELQENVADVQLIAQVPESVREVIRRAKKLYIYGFFEYAFFTVAAHYAYGRQRMTIRDRGGIWHYRFKADGREYSGTTDLAATRQNVNRALAIELEHRQALMEGRRPTRKLIVRQFSDAADEFLVWAEVEYRAHPNSFKRIKTSFTSLKEFFGTKPASLVNDAAIEQYKVWRFTEHEVRAVTLRHDLHALSVFFGYAIKQNWARDNPVRDVDIPSDAEAVRIHVITAAEEKEYFARAAKNRNLWDLARLMRNQGMRPEEVLALGKADIDLERGTLLIRTGKTPAARRTLNLTAESKSILARRVSPTIPPKATKKAKQRIERAQASPWVFPSPSRPGQHILRLNRAHDAVCLGNKKRAHLSFVLYDWRHTFATRLAESGVDLARVTSGELFTARDAPSFHTTSCIRPKLAKPKKSNFSPDLLDGLFASTPTRSFATSPVQT